MKIFLPDISEQQIIWSIPKKHQKSGTIFKIDDTGELIMIAMVKKKIHLIRGYAGTVQKRGTITIVRLPDKY